jgi:hypothetical protein
LFGWDKDVEGVGGFNDHDILEFTTGSFTNPGELLGKGTNATKVFDRSQRLIARPVNV